MTPRSTSGPAKLGWEGRPLRKSRIFLYLHSIRFQNGGELFMVPSACGCLKICHFVVFQDSLIRMSAVLDSLPEGGAPGRRGVGNSLTGDSTYMKPKVE